MTVTVTAVNDAPVAAPDHFSAPEDTPLTGNVLGNDADAESDHLTATLLFGPAHGGLTLLPDGSFTYTPAGNYHGADSFAYKVSDGQGGVDFASASIDVTSVDDPPAAQAGAPTPSPRGARCTWAARRPTSTGTR